MIRLVTAAVVAGCVVAFAASCGGGASQTTGTAPGASQGGASSPSDGSNQGVPSWAARAVANSDPNVIQGLCEQAQSIANAGVNLSHNYHVMAAEFGQQWARDHNDTVAHGETIYAAVWQHCGLPPVSQPAPSSTATTSTSGGSSTSVPPSGSSAPAKTWWGFATPSRNIVCNFGSLGSGLLNCTVGSAGPTNWTIRAHGVARRVQPPGNIGSDVPSLAYGKRWARDGLTCDSKETGLTCRNRDHHGFFLSRESQRTF